MGEIIIKDLWFSFNNSGILIKCPLFSFKPGNIYALIWANGSRKTTSLKLILGLLKPTKGIIHGLEDKSIAFVPDYNGLYDSLSVLENIKFRLSLYNKSYKAEKESVKRLLARYQLDNETHKLVKEMKLKTEYLMFCLSVPYHIPGCWFINYLFLR